MITSLKIERFRGVKTGHVPTFFPFTVVVGPNNSGKSTLLEAAILAHWAPWSIFPYLVGRRGWEGLVTLLGTVRDGSSVLEAVVDGTPRTTQIATSGVVDPHLQQMALTHGLELPVAPVRFVVLQPEASGAAPQKQSEMSIVFDRKNKHQLGHHQNRDVIQRHEMKGGFIDAQISVESIRAAVGELRTEQHLRYVVKCLRELDDGVRDIRMLHDSDEWIPHVVYETDAVPMTMMGDGFKMLFTCASYLARMAAGGVLAMEEPETFMHAAAVKHLIAMCWSAVDRGAQIILATHSMDLLRGIREEYRKVPERAGKLGLLEPRLAAGVLSVTERPDAIGPFLDQLLNERLSGEDRKL